MALSAQESAKSSTGSCKVCKQREMGVNQDVQAGGSLWGDHSLLPSGLSKVYVSIYFFFLKKLKQTMEFLV